MTKHVLLLFLLIAVGHHIYAVDDPDYSKIFGDSYSEAMKYLGNNQWMGDTLKSRGIHPVFAISIVFPEMLRYNQLKELFEVSALLTLYIQYGSDYSNFSVGYFQMKPSFAEQLETIWNSMTPKPFECKEFNVTETTAARSERISRITTPKGQLLYLSIFIAIMEKRFPSYNSSSNIFKKVTLYSTAYNYGFNKSGVELMQKSKESTFYTDFLKGSTTTYYCYADISRYFYKKHIQLYH